MISVKSEKLIGVVDVIKFYKKDVQNLGDVVIYFTKDGANIRVGDASNICRTDITLYPTWFETYSPTVDKIGIRFEMLPNVVKFAGKDCIVSFEKLKDNIIQIHLVNDKIAYTLTAVTIADKALRELKALTGDFYDRINEHCNSYNVSHEEFSTILSNLESYASIYPNDDMEFYIDKNGVFTITAGDVQGEIGDIETKMDIYPINIVHEDGVGARYRMTFNTIMRKEMSMISKDEPYARVHVGNNTPMLIEFPIHDNTGDMSFVVAPLIVPNDESDEVRKKKAEKDVKTK